MKRKLFFGVFVFSVCLSAQTSAPPAPSGPPIHVLYRLFFRDIAALDAAADKADAAGQPGGSGLRAWYQKSLLLTPAEIGTLKHNAAQCNQTLDQHQQTAQPVIAAVQAAVAAGTAPPSPPAQLVALEQQRIQLANTCIQNLHSALGDRKFTDIDVFVRTKFAQKVSAIPLAGAPFANVPAPTHPAGGGK